MMQTSKFIHIMPDRLELLSEKSFHCTEKNCLSTFKSQSNLTLHLLKSHRKNVSLSFRERNHRYCYHCPEQDCVYHESEGESNGKNCFTQLKHLKQHFRKVHKNKDFQCSNCDKGFPDDFALKRHAKICGYQFYCGICGLKYKNNQSLVHHVKQKGHQFTMSVFDDSLNNSPTSSSKEKDRLKAHQASQTDHIVRKSNKKRGGVSQMTQTSRICKKAKTSSSKESSLLTQRQEVAATQTLPIDLNILDDPLLMYTDNSSQTGHDLISDILNMDSKLCHTETQTENRLLFTDSIEKNISDPLLFNNMHTQTSEELLADLSMDTQTQTHWDTEFNFDSYLVSTETQTCIPRLNLFQNNSSTYTQTSQSIEYLDQLNQTYNSIQTQT